MARHIGQVARITTQIPPGGYWPDLLYRAYCPIGDSGTYKVPCDPGFRIADSMGRVFYLVETSEVVTKGNVVSHSVASTAIAATKFDLEPVGETVFNLDITVTAATYTNGLLCLTEGTGAGDMYLIRDHGAGTAATSDCVLNITGEVLTATSASDTVGYLMKNPFYGVTIANHANPAVEAPLGRAMATTSVTGANNKYCWVQTWGPCLLMAGTLAVGAGDTIGLAESASGSVVTLVTTEDPAFVGVSVTAIADGAWGLCHIRCIP